MQYTVKLTRQALHTYNASCIELLKATPIKGELEYFDYFNLRALVKSLLDKMEKVQHRPMKATKQISLAININYFESWEKYLKENKGLQGREIDYEVSVLADIIFQVDPQRANLKQQINNNG